MTPADIRFAADGMLQSLGTWLRLLGYDCLMWRSKVAAGFTPACSWDHAPVKGAATGPAGGVSCETRCLLEQAVAEDRVFLTRNTHLADSLPHELLHRASVRFVLGEHLPAQLHEVVEKFSLETSHYVFTRCVGCNVPLRQVTATEAAGQVPGDVLTTADEFWRCDACAKTFWRGSHVRNSLDHLQHWLAIRHPAGG